MESCTLDSPGTNTTKRRSSSRTIKRKKFDDELVETRFNLEPRPRPSWCLSCSTNGSWKSEVGQSGGVIATTIIPTSRIQLEKTNKRQAATGATGGGTTGAGRSCGSNDSGGGDNGFGGGGGRKSKKNENHNNSINATKDLGRWKPTDDLALITGVQQTNDLRIVHRGTKFSCRFTLQELQQRWYALLYDSAVSRVAVQAMRNLHAELIANTQSKTCYSKAEEDIIGTIKSNHASSRQLETFQQLLETNSQIFHPARTAKSLMAHWQLMKQYHLLPDQSIQPLVTVAAAAPLVAATVTTTTANIDTTTTITTTPAVRRSHDTILNFSDAEDMINDTELIDQKDESIDMEMVIVDRKNKKEIRVLENEMGRWQVLVDNVAGPGVNPPDFDNQTLAILRGRLVRYLMRSKEITVGRCTKDHTVDVDLTLEGPAWKVSRRQGTIRLRNNGDFFLSAEGKRPIFVDSRPILPGNKMKLNNNSVIEIAGLRFIFLINQELTSVIRQEAIKLNLNP